MELRELATSTFKQNAIHAFNLTSSGLNVGLLGSTSDVVLLEMKHSNLATHTFPYAVETTKLPTDSPASKIVNQYDMAAIYLEANCLQRQYFALDPVYVYELSEDPIKFQPIVLAWSPNNLLEVSTLAVVCNNGTCELRRRDTISREWKIVLCNLNHLYYQMFPVQSSNRKNTFESLKEAVENTCTTAFSWNMDPANANPIFLTANATGWILLFTLKNNGSVSCFQKYKTNLGRISYVYFIKSFIMTCCANGTIKLFKLKVNEIVEVETLWPKADRIPCKKVHMTFCTETNNWIVVTSKASHIIVFVLSREGKLLLKNTRYLGNIKITGFDILSPMEYIFVTITGVVKLIKLQINKDKVEINDENIKYEFDHENYQILGLVASPNKVAWTFILHHNKPYTHPSIYSPNDAIVSVCSFNCKDAFEMLTGDTGNTIANFIDCAEIIRLEILKDNISSKFDKICIQEIKISKHFFKKLQLKLLIMNAGLTYQRIKFNHVKKVITNEISSITKIIECVYINLRLQHIRSLKKHSNFQLLTGKCMKYRLKSLHAELIPKEDVFRNIHENLNTLSDCLLMDLGTMFDEAQENCSYCDTPVDFSTLTCPDLHSVPRCSISYLQVPLFTKVFCASCNRLFIDDIENLKSIFADAADEMKCTFCGFLIHNDRTESFDGNEIEME